MIRTIWLAVICLVGLGVMVALKVGTASLASADVSRVEAPAAQAIGQSHALMKSDRLEVVKIEPAVEMTVTPVPTVPAKIVSESREPTTKIVSRHWHDPLAPIAKPDTDSLKGKSKKTATAR
jgi:hypothetical protein